MQSVGGALVGVLLFVASFAVLWVNEGRADLSKLAAKAMPASSSAEGKLAYVTGALSATAPIGDSEYLKPGPYIRLDRNVEMFAWAEETHETTKDKLGGGTDVTTTYDYKKEWTAHPSDATKFKYPDGHGNPSLNIQDQTVFASSATIGDYTVDPKTIELPNPEAVILNPDAAITNNSVRQDGNTLYTGKGNATTPEVGDVRISFKAVRSGTMVTAFGKIEGTQMTSYAEGKTVLYRALLGTHDAAIATLSTEHKAVGWILRLVGFAMMWIGLLLCFGPINAVLKVVPLMGAIGRGITGIAMFLVALVLSAVTIVVAMIAHSVIALIIALVVVAGLIVFIAKKHKK